MPGFPHAMPLAGFIGGLITAAIGHLPEAGEELTLGRFRFRVARADARRLIALHVDVHADA